MSIRVVVLRVALLTSATLFSSQSALAQGDFADTVREGLSEFEAGEWAEARTLFLRAHEIRPSAEALRMAGNASYENREYVLSVELLEQALAAEEGALRADRVPMAQEALEAASRFVTRLTIQTRHDVLIDQRTIEANEEVVLVRGPHELEVNGVGFETQRRHLNLHTAQETVEVTLQVSVGDLQAVEDTPAVDEERSRTGLWVTLGIIGVAIAGGVVAAILLTRDETPPLGANAPGSVVYTLGQP